RSVVDLPLPLAPSSVTISPSRTLSDTPSSARRCPYETLSPSISSIATLAGTSRILRAAEVRLDHRRVGGDLARLALGDLAPVVQDDHAVGDAHDQVHVVLDHDQRQPQLVAQADDEVHERARLGGVEPTGGLVEQHAARLGGEGARQLQALLPAEGQAARLQGGDVAEAEALQQRQRALARRPLFPRDARRPDGGAEDAAGEP